MKKHALRPNQLLLTNVFSFRLTHYGINATVVDETGFITFADPAGPTLDSRQLAAELSAPTAIYANASSASVAMSTATPTMGRLA